MNVVKIKLPNVISVVSKSVADLEKQQNSDTPPPLILNKHCVECEFQMRCRKETTDKDDLSLFSAMTKKERDKYHEKGIFTITQLSHTFRPRRKSKHLTNERHEKNSHPLRALAIREQKIHIIGNPQLQMTGTPIYLDVEGDPDRDFYYLLGMRFTESEVLTTHSFWADEIVDEKKLWISFLAVIQKLDSPQLIYYGSYEKTYLEKMRQRYGELDIAPAFLDQIQARAINLLSFLFGQIYFPTYSNSLKEIARYLRFEWTEKAASGITSLMWRYYWEKHKNHDYKEKLLVYNTEDCEAVERLTRFLLRLNNKQSESLPTDDEVIQAESLKPLYPFESKFGKTEFVLPEFQAINKAAYWDYQQEKVYFRSQPQRKRASSKKRKLLVQKTRVNKTIPVERQMFSLCPRCHKSSFVKNGRYYKIVHDIKFSSGGVKRWIVKYYYSRQRCKNCGATLRPKHRPWTGSKYGHNLVAYAIYSIIDLQISQSATAKNIQQIFGFPVGDSTINQFKTRAAAFYKESYENLLQKVKSSKLIHADETRINLKGGLGYVWVLTSLEEVIYFCTATREGDKLKEHLKAFRGVLVSDFYSVYDAFDCPQQKCLIHLMRDLNDALRKEPFNQELKELVQAFASLLKPMIETIDRFGLKAHFLRKHKIAVKNFYRNLSVQNYKSLVTQALLHK